MLEYIILCWLRLNLWNNYQIVKINNLPYELLAIFIINLNIKDIWYIFGGDRWAMKKPIQLLLRWTFAPPAPGGKGLKWILRLNWEMVKYHPLSPSQYILYILKYPYYVPSKNNQFFFQWPSVWYNTAGPPPSVRWNTTCNWLLTLVVVSHCFVVFETHVSIICHMTVSTVICQYHLN